jgi:hypothetical protein
VSEVKVAPTEIGAYEKTLVASAVHTVVFEGDPDAVEIDSDGAAAVSLTLDGTVPTVAGANCEHLPAGACARRYTLNRGAPHTIKLISAGTPKINVAGVSE